MPNRDGAKWGSVARAWKALSEAERRVLQLRFMHDLTQREIGERMGYSQMHVSRLLRRALSRLDRGTAPQEARRPTAACGWPGPPFSNSTG